MSLNIFSLARKIRGEEPMFPEKGGGGGGTTTVQKADPWKPAQAQLEDILKQAKTLYNKNGGLDAEAVQRAMPSLTPEMVQSLTALASSGQLNEVADNINKYTTSAGKDIAAAEKMANDFANKDFGIKGSDINALSSQLYDSETVRSQKEQLSKDLQEQYENNVKQLNQSAVTSGAMGNSRAGVAQGVMAGKSQANLEKGEADIMNSARGQAQQAALATLQGNQQAKLNQYTQGMQTLGNMGTTLASQFQAGSQAQGQLYQQALQNKYQAAQVNQQMQAAQQETDYQNKLAEQNAAYENLSKYSNMVSGIGGAGQTSTATQSGGGGASKAQSALGGAMTGAAAGASIGGPWGAVAGGVIGGVSSMFSDATLKKKIKLKGKTKSGDEVYDWEWNEKGNSKGLKGKATGVLAQRTDVDAVGQKQGALAVNYAKTSVNPKVNKK